MRVKKSVKSRITINRELVNFYKRRRVPKTIKETIPIDTGINESTSQKESQPASSFENNTNNKKDESGKDRYQYEGRKRKGDVLEIASDQSIPKKQNFLGTLQAPSVSFKDIGGIDKILEKLSKLLIHVHHPEVYRRIRILPLKGFLLHGPSGCGKTLLATAIAGEMGVPLLKVDATELVAEVSGETEDRIRNLFETAICSTPCILFIDKIDAVSPNRQNVQTEMERRIVAQLLSCLDDLSQNECGDRVLVIGATDRLDAIDPTLRRAGRFDQEIYLGIPDVQSRVQILKVLTSKLKLSDKVDYGVLAQHTSGYVGADLMSLTREAAMNTVNRVLNKLTERYNHDQRVTAEKTLEEKQTDKVSQNDPKIINIDNDVKTDVFISSSKEAPIVVIDKEVLQIDTVLTSEISNEHLIRKEKTIPNVGKQSIPLKDLMMWLHDRSPLSNEELSAFCITMDDFNEALKYIQPSANRKYFPSVPDVSWDDVGSLKSVIEELRMAILAPIRHIEHFKELGLNTRTGVLLCGPPGCGKTLIAKAMANEVGINFISIKGLELLNMYVGESKRAVRACFERAQNCAPCIIFLDELDAICSKPSDTRKGRAIMRVMNDMLTEIDRVQDRRGVYIIGASNRPDIIDPKVLRPGRFDKILFVGLPTANDRIEILRAITKNGTRPRLASDVDLKAIATSQQCRGYTGADLAALVKEAGMVALKEFMICGDMQKSLVVNMKHFTKAVAKIRPSVPEKDQLNYENLRKVYAAVPDNKFEIMLKTWNIFKQCFRRVLPAFWRGILD